MAKGKKKSGPKQKFGKQKKGKGKSKKGGKDKTKPQPKTQLEIKLTEQMNKRIGKKPKPMKVLQDKFKKLMERYDRKGVKRPVRFAHRYVQKAPKVSAPKPPVDMPADFSFGVGELGNVNQVRRSTMTEKRRGMEDDSPIDIDTKIVKKCNYLRLTFEGLFDPERKTVITNSGYHIIGRLGGDVLISNGPLFGKYKLENFHVHYGEGCNDGTEHSINGRKYTLELHMVFLPYSENIDIFDMTFNETAKKVVLGLMFKLSRQPCYYDLFSIVAHINKKGKSLETSNNLLYDFKDILSGSEYYNYHGSATEGDFKEYEWMLFKKVLPINKSQMQNMWDLRMFDAVKSNVKPAQPLGERSIFTPYYYDHQKCRGKEKCDCFGRSFIPSSQKTPLSVT